MSKNTTRSPAEMMMHGRRFAEGGSTNSLPDNIPHFNAGGISSLKGGGRSKPFMRNGRACHAEGDSVLPTGDGVNPVTGHKYGAGDASYSESVKETKLRKGGRARKRHAAGDSVNYNDDDDGSSSYRKGGPARRRHAEGDSVSKTEAVPFKRGGRTRREHHDWGGFVRGLGNFGEMFNPFDSHGLSIGDAVKGIGNGLTYLKSSGKLGNSAQASPSATPGGSTGAPQLRKGGSPRRRHSDSRQHHDFGDVVKKIGSFASSFLPLLPMLLKEGGSTEDGAKKLAMGGVGKVRKGIITNKGRLIK